MSYTVAPERITLRMAFALFMFTVMPIGVGAWALYGMSIGPWLRWSEARDWVPTPCFIAEHWVEMVHPEDDSDSYSLPHFIYTYTFDRKQYTSSRWHIMGIKDEVGSPFERQELYPEKTEQTCYVNPENPAEAVLDISWDWNIIGGLFPLVLLLFGLFCLFMFVFMTGNRSISRSGEKADWRPKTAKPQSGRTLQEHYSHARMSLPWFFFAGVVLLMPAYFVWYYFNYEMPVEEVWAMFTLAGFIAGCAGLLVFKGLKLLLQAAQLRPVIRLEPDTLLLGSTGKLVWRFDRRHDRLQHLKIWLEGYELLEYYENKTWHVHTSVFEHISIVETASPDDAFEGTATFNVPGRTMHSFEAVGAQIIWSIKMSMAIAGMPDTVDEFRVLVLPHPIGATTK